METNVNSEVEYEMRKLKLDLEQLGVQSFVTDAAAGNPGTVLARGITHWCTDDPTYSDGDYSCDGNSCPAATCDGCATQWKCTDTGGGGTGIWSCVYTECDNCIVTVNEVVSCNIPC